MTLDKRF